MTTPVFPRTTRAGRSLRVCCFPLELGENAYLEILYGHLRAQDLSLVDYDWLRSGFADVDVFHVQWPDAVVMGRSRFRAILKFILFRASVAIFRLRGVPIVYSVNNLGSHDQIFPRIERALWAFFIPRVSLFVHMNAQSKAALMAKFPASGRARHILAPHPHYRSTVSGKAARASARAPLGLAADAFTFLSFGLLRPYKGIEGLIAAFRSYTDDSARLIVAGRAVDSAYAKTIRGLAEGDPRIVFDERFVPDQELESYIAACDVVVLAHRKLNNSGVAMLALSCDRPIVAPSVGAILDLERQVGPGWVTCFGDEGPDATTLARAASAARALPEGARPDLSANDPAVVAAPIRAAYFGLAASRDRRALPFLSADRGR